jgi:hypothetical protein
MASTDPQARVDEEADAIVANLTAAVGDDPTEDERITSADIYDTTHVAGTRYMIGGGGPTSHLTVIDDAFGHTIVLVEVHGWSENALRVIRGRDAAKIAGQFARAERGLQ